MFLLWKSSIVDECEVLTVGGQDCPERGFLHVLAQAALFPSN